MNIDIGIHSVKKIETTTDILHTENIGDFVRRKIVITGEDSEVVINLFTDDNLDADSLKIIEG